jgi:predicted hydrocarbon binding protein
MRIQYVSSLMTTVNARIPLSLLEAIRRIDTPDDPTETEYVAELRNKRLGLSDTVFTQIRRYNEALKRGQRIPFGEAEGIGTLIGRRADAAELFQNAGHIFAESVYGDISATARGTIKSMPGFVSTPMAIKRLRAVAEKFFDGQLDRTGSFLSLKVKESVTVNGAPRSAGCQFYEVAFADLLRLLVGAGEKVDHVLCLQRGEGVCEWRAEWRG